jgi:uncharacterized protein YjbI with pentapeptide repeats
VADNAQVKILRGGFRDWNEWRKANPEILPDLSWADLSKTNLRRANLRWSDLSKAKLSAISLREANLISADLNKSDISRTDLSGANLNGANLSGADLSQADLSGADLRSANFSSAKLCGANLGGAQLFKTNLDAVDLAEADFSNCIMQETQLGNVDLSRSKGLEAVKHKGPSSVGIDTIYRSGGNIPEVFLRGAGVPEPFIVQMKSLVAAMSPIEFYSCFISYSSKDQECAERLHADLVSKRVRCWFAPEDLKIGSKLRPSFDEAIRVHDKLMVLLSEHSVKSPWVEKEVETAFEKERQQKRTVLFPIRLDDAVMETDEAWAADIRRTRHIGDFRNWKDHDSYKKGFDRLLRDLKAEGKAEPD